MAFFGNKRKDFSIQPPRQQVDGTPFFVTDSANIDFTLENLNLTANLTQLLPTSGTYGDATHIPVLQIDQFGRVTGVNTVAIGGGGNVTGTGTPTRVAIWTGTTAIGDDSLFYWDNTNKALAIGAASSPLAAARLYLFSSTNNADVFIESIFNQRLKFKNTTTSVQWHTSTNTFGAIDSYNIGQSSNPALGYLEILKSGRVKIGVNIAGTLGFTDSIMLELGLTGTRAGQMILNALTSGNITLKATDTTAPYTFTFPDKPISANLFLKTDASGNTSWATVTGSGTVINVATAGLISGGPITVSGTITTSMNTNKLVGRYSAGTGIMEEISVGSGLTLTGAGTLNNTATPTPLGYYGAFSDVTDQFATVINTGYPMRLGITDLTNGVTVVSNSRVTIANTGIYNIQWSAQFRNPAAAEHDVTVWLRKNGVDVPGSSGVVLVPAKHGSSDGHTLPSWNFLLDVVAGDYYEFVWSTDSTVVFISHEPVGSYAPSTASVVLTVTQQSGILAGTGITGLGTAGNIQTGATQTLATGTSGTAFAIVSSGNTQTFNIPLASTASVTAGLLSKSEFDLFSVGSFGVTFDGGGALITSGKIAYVRVPYKGTITGWQLVADQSGSCSIAVKQGTFGGFPPSVTIFTAALSGTQTSSATGLSLAVTAGDWFSFTITGTSAVTWVNLSISITKII